MSFDEAMVKFCRQREQTYSRYADDMTISGDSRPEIQNSIYHARKLLSKEYGLRLNKSKTRIASRHSQQNVTGIVVNEKLLPPRKKRRDIRQKFYVADKFGVKSPDDLNKLRGYYGYLNAFPELRDSKTLEGYKEVLEKLGQSGSENE